MVKSILNSDTESVQSFATSTPAEPAPPTPSSRLKTRHATAPGFSAGNMSRVYPAKSEPDLTGRLGGGKSAATSSTGAIPRTPASNHSRARTAYTGYTPSSAIRGTGRRGRSPPPTKPVSQYVTSLRRGVHL